MTWHYEVAYKAYFQWLCSGVVLSLSKVLLVGKISFVGLVLYRVPSGVCCCVAGIPRRGVLKKGNDE